MGPLLEVLAVRRPDGLHLIVRGELDIATAPEVETALAAAQEGTAEAIILDLSGVTFLDSTGVRALIEAAIVSGENGNRLSVISSPAVDRLIDLCDLRERLPLA